MNPHLHHVLDTCIVTVATLATAASSVMLGNDTSQAAELQLLMLPLIGALLMSGAAIMLNPQPETRRIVIGRAMIALFLGTLTPQIISVIHPKLAEFSSKPVFLLMIGGLSAGIFYVLSRPFFGELYKRADRIAARGADRLEDKLAKKAESPTTKL